MYVGRSRKKSCGDVRGQQELAVGGKIGSLREILANDYSRVI